MDSTDPTTCPDWCTDYDSDSDSDGSRQPAALVLVPLVITHADGQARISENASSDKPSTDNAVLRFFVSFQGRSPRADMRRTAADLLQAVISTRDSAEPFSDDPRSYVLGHGVRRRRAAWRRELRRPPRERSNRVSPLRTEGRHRDAAGSAQ